MPADLEAKALGVDYGTKRIGLALASLSSKLPQPYKTLNNDETLNEKLISIINSHNVKYIIVGLPRNLSGQDTNQTSISKSFIKQLSNLTDLPVIVKDEALTSVMAIEELDKSKKPYSKSDIDALAASYILEDWLSEDYTH